MDAVFVNPKAVETGLNLTMFSRGIYFEIPYSLYTARQAAARLRRPTSPSDIEIVYINVVDTIVERALGLLFEKKIAADIFRASSIDAVMTSVVGTSSFMVELVKRVMEEAEVEDLEALFARANRVEHDMSVPYELPSDVEWLEELTVSTSARRHSVRVPSKLDANAYSQKELF